jgi:hypothetical protein
MRLMCKIFNAYFAVNMWFYRRKGMTVKVVHDILDSSEAHQNQMMQQMADPSNAANFARIVFDLLVQGQSGNR